MGVGRDADVVPVEHVFAQRRLPTRSPRCQRRGFEPLGGGSRPSSPVATRLPDDASKAGVVALTRAVAVQYADRGIRANCVCPGHVATGLKSHSAETMASVATGPASAPASAVRVPMDRRGEPSEIAAAVAFLCSVDSSFMTGATVMVDGGYTIV